MALWIPPIGAAREVFPKNLAKGFSLKELYELIGFDYIEILQIFDNQRMVVEDNGHLKKLPLNPRATVFYQVGRSTGWAIVGNVVLCSSSELQ